MPLLVYVVCRHAVLGAAVAGGLHCGYGMWRHRQGHRLPLLKGSAEEAVVAWATGAAVGQLCVSIPFLLGPYHASLAHTAWATISATLLLSPLYASAAHPSARRLVAQHVPSLIGGSAGVTAVLVYVFRGIAPTGNTAAFLTSALSVCLGVCGVSTFLFAHRYNAVALHLVNRAQAQGVVIPCGSCMPMMNLVLGDVLALLLVLEAGAVTFCDWWTLCSLSIMATPSMPSILTQYNRRPVDIEHAMVVHFGTLAAVFVLALLLPKDPAAWALASQLYVSHGEDWQSLEDFEEEPRLPPAAPLQPGVGHRMDSTSPSATTGWELVLVVAQESPRSPERCSGVDFPVFGSGEPDEPDPPNLTLTGLTENQMRELHARAAEARLNPQTRSLEEPD